MTMEEIYQGLMEEFRGRTGLSAAAGGELAVRFYAVAAQIYSLYTQAEWTLRQCFPQTATGGELDKHAALRNVTRRPAAKATGTVRFFAATDRTQASVIPVGTVCLTAEGVRYLTTAEGSIATEETEADVPVEADQAGAGGNAPPGRVLYLALPPEGVTVCTNPEAITGGVDGEEDGELRQRVLDTYRRLANGANGAFYEQCALEYPGVASVKVLPRNRGVGTVDVVVSAQGGLPDETLLDGLQTRLDSLREIAVDVGVLSPTARAVDITASVTVAEGADSQTVLAAVDRAVRGKFTGHLLGKSVLRAELIALVFAVEGVANCDVAMDGGDVAAEAVTLPVLGTLTVTEA